MNDLSRTDAASPADADPLNALWPLLGRHIAFHRRLVDVTGCVKAALLLSQVIYWTRHGRDVPRSGGWFTKTAQQWQWETGLTEREQGRVRTILRGRALIAEQRKGLPARLHFRLQADRLAQALLQETGAPCLPVWSDDSHALGPLLGPSVAYHRILAHVTDGVHAALMLSRALHLARQERQGPNTAWIVRSCRQWTDDLGLTRREQETARRLLVDLGLWEERQVGMPRRTAARVRIDVLIGLLSILPTTDQTHTSRGGLHGDDLACSAAPIRESIASDSPPPDSTEAPTRWGRNRPHSADPFAGLLIQGSTSSTLQPPHRFDAGLSRDADLGGGGLVFPSSFASEEREAARVLLDPVASQAQLLLDELSGRMQANAVRSTPIAYLRGLVMRAIAGSFIPEAGIAVAVGRRKRELEEAERLQVRRADRDWSAERESPAFQRQVAERRAQMQQWLATHRGTEPTGRKS